MIYKCQGETKLIARFVVRVDLERVRKSVSHADGMNYSEEAITQLLEASGFIPQPDGSWIVSESDLGLLQPDEIISLSPVDDDLVQ